MITTQHGMVGKSPQIQKIHQLIEIGAKNDVNVLIYGETGTGKELVAKALHERSARNKAPFIVVNCAAIPDELAESELFGHEKGSFTSAVKQRAGKIELANEGTIFFDEIGEMDMPMQAKLLRVIEDKVVNRLGSDKYKKVDTKIIAATNKSLKQKALERTFRDDLYYRLSIFCIFLPPLRDRKEDIPLLAEYFLEATCQQLKKDIFSITSEAIECLMRYNWPGNIRELKNVMARAVVFAKEPVLSKEDINTALQGQALPAKEPWLSFSANPPLDEMEKVAIKRMLIDNDGNKRKTAEDLGIGRSSLYWKIKRYGLN